MHRHSAELSGRNDPVRCGAKLVCYEQIAVRP